MKPAISAPVRVWLLAGLSAAGVLNAQPELPEGEGRQQVEQVCTGCHSLQPVTSIRHSRAEWRAEVDNMIGMGAEATELDQDAIVEYLSRHYGPDTVSWPLYCAGAGLLSGALLLGRHRLKRVRKKDTVSAD